MDSSRKTSKDITELRKAGQLSEALELATLLLVEKPDDIWVKRAASWVHYEYLKANATPSGKKRFAKHLEALQALNLSAEEDLLFGQVTWKIGSLIFSLAQENTLENQVVNRIFSAVRTMPIPRPSEGASFMLKAFQKINKEWSNYLAFIDWFGLDNLRKEDYRKEEFNGRRIMAVAEQVYIAYAKRLLVGVPTGGFGSPNAIDKEKVVAFMPLLDKVIEEHPEYQYPAYYKAQFLIAMGDGQEALDAFLPFAKQKKNDFWVWTMMADLFPEEEDVQFACYCKALSLKPPVEYTGKAKTTFAGLLIQRGNYDAAKTEIEQVVRIQEKNGWNTSAQLTNWQKQDWYATARSRSNNEKLYKRHLQQAEEILYRNLPVETIVIEFVNSNKHVANFVKNERKYGFFTYTHLGLTPSIGDILNVRFSTQANEGYFKVATAKKLNADSKCEALRSFSGSINKREGQEFSFVDQVFIAPDITARHGLQQNHAVTGTAVLSYNKKRKQWGWKAVSLVPHQHDATSIT
ncbi:hypothetical protein LEM8419_00353 [Neolewinella maritima]|uniref:Tetratricopeptide repeat protein n=1 Tax=Neolewinella maritima TaxID=1383882 RepID=A0ABN8F1T8_9BACT|nr:hypothetical protein [Neolewinella maritima]CAH0999058.1 hypothetical protein LEM8419_00353 [Neolewinella maritima]